MKWNINKEYIKSERRGNNSKGSIVFFRKWNNRFYQKRITVETDLKINPIKIIQRLFNQFNNKKTFKNYKLYHFQIVNMSKDVILSPFILCQKCKKKLAKYGYAIPSMNTADGTYNIESYCPFCWEHQQRLKRLKA